VIRELPDYDCGLDSPPLESRSWDTINLSILEIAELAPSLPLSKVKAFLDIFLKLSGDQALVRETPSGEGGDSPINIH
jgi:hypothetical protein